ncbi:MAG: hypothetical protein ACRDJX_05215 [Solirubrobacteraceae bacterium]
MIPSIRRSQPVLAAACVLAILTGVASGAQARTTGADAATGANLARNLQAAGNGSKAAATATLEQCLTALLQGERTATFAGEMLAITGTARMEINIGLLEKDAGEPQYHPVRAPGLGGWRGSAPGVKNYTYIKQVTNLGAPALYRGSVRFRWLNDKGRVIRAEEIRTPRCDQSAPSSTSFGAPTTTTTPSASGDRATA